MTQRAQRDLFLELAVEEPALYQLEADILNEAYQSKLGDRDYFCANYRWIKDPGYKQRLCKLVGYEAQNPDLRSEKFYNLAYDYLYNLLPDCFNCHCFYQEKAPADNAD